MAKGPRPRPAADRFWSKVKKADGDGCWEWTAYRCPNGYGHFGWRRDSKRDEVYLSHRVAWEMTYGPFPDERLCVLHRCDNPPCVRPDHLFLGTRTDNANDRTRKGRTPTGNGHPNAVLTEQLVREIHAAISSGGATIAEMSRRHGVKQGTIGSFMQGRNWRHLNLYQQTS